MKDFVGNSTTIKYLEQAVTGDNLSHAYLFCGPEGVGKTKAGVYLAKLLLCEGENPLNCDSCASCKLFASGNHPDFFQIDREVVLVDEIRELVSSLDLKPYRGRGKVALISHAERLTNQALNSFLKTLEEPSAHTTIILTTENKKNLLPTIVSRARMVNFNLVSDKEIYELLNGDLEVKKDEAAIICKLAAGRAGIATTFAQNAEQSGEIIALTNDFNRIYRSQDIYEKISYAEKLSKDKDTLGNKLQNLELAARSELLGSKDKARSAEIVSLMDKIAKSRERLAKNANTKLVIEGLLLGSII